MNDHALIGARIRAAGIDTGLLNRPYVAFVAIALGLLRALTLGGINEDPLRRGAGTATVRGGGVTQALNRIAAAAAAANRKPVGPFARKCSKVAYSILVSVFNPIP